MDASFRKGIFEDDDAYFDARAYKMTIMKIYVETWIIFVMAL